MKTQEIKEFMYIWMFVSTQILLALLAGAVGYIDCISAEG